jgi:hypothetical protein
VADHKITLEFKHADVIDQVCKNLETINTLLQEKKELLVKAISEGVVLSR